jgi:hypothetical protein
MLQWIVVVESRPFFIQAYSTDSSPYSLSLFFSISVCIGCTERLSVLEFITFKLDDTNLIASSNTVALVVGKSSHSSIINFP